jgi:hypothetical protein
MVMAKIGYLEFRSRFGTCRFFPEPANVELKKLARALLDNYERINQSLAVPGSMAFAGLWTQHMWSQAMVDVARSGATTPGQVDDERIGARFKELKRVPVPAAETAHVQRLANAIVTSAESPDLNPDAKLLWQGLEAIMIGAVTAAYTAFEVVAADVWKVCVNARPRLGFVALNAEPSAEDGEDELARKQRTRIPVPAWMLKSPDFDIRSRMGDLLCAMQKWDFANRRETRDAYVKVFPESKSQIDTIFTNEGLRCLAAIRNAVVHNACYADAEFVKLVTRFPTLNAITVGDRIRIDGDVFGQIAMAGFEQGKALLLFADEWLTNNTS